jgi:5-methylcytosine-specific restriction protein A
MVPVNGRTLSLSRERSGSESGSWRRITGKVAVKRMDRSSFLYGEIAIPVGLRSFFNTGEMEPGEKRPVVLTHGIVDYPAYLEMVNTASPRTRLVWKRDLRSFIREKFPAWVEYFSNHTEHKDSAPDLKFVKTGLRDKFLIFFEDTQKSSASLDLLTVYSRDELRDQFHLSDAIISEGVFRQPDARSVWLFVTAENTRGASRVGGFFDGLVLLFESPVKGRGGSLILNHERDGNEIIVFYRKKKREFANYGFRYLGRFGLAPPSQAQTGMPPRLVLLPLDVMTDDADGALVAAGPNPSPFEKGTGKTRIQTRIERDPALRAQAIRIHGARCSACGFDFAEQYGSLGEGYIEIHYRGPDSPSRKERARETRVDPVTDLIPLCSNCHRMIHRPETMLGTEELKELIR